MVVRGGGLDYGAVRELANPAPAGVPMLTLAGAPDLKVRMSEEHLSIVTVRRVLKELKPSQVNARRMPGQAMRAPD